MLFVALLIASMSLSGIAGASASDVGTVQTQTNTSIIKESMSTQSENVNNSYTSTTTQTNVTANPKPGTDNTTVTSTKQNATASETTPLTNEITFANSTTKSTNTTQYAAAGTVTSTATTATNAQVIQAANYVKNYVEANHKLPSTVIVNGRTINMYSFLYMLSTAVQNLYNHNNNSVPIKSYNRPQKTVESIVTGNIYLSEYIHIADVVKVYMDKTGYVPGYASPTSLGTYISWQSMIYMYSKILNFQKTNNYLPNYVSVKPWISIVNPAITQARPVYITSDNIIGYTTDMNRINTIVNGLKALGLTAINWGLGPNTHNTVLQSSIVPSNALIVDLYGGACAGTIYEMGLSYYKNLVGSKKVFSVWIPPSTDITGLAWLPRAHDDNFSPASFTGLAHPDQYLLNNGYHYIYSGDLNAIISAIFKEATT